MSGGASALKEAIKAGEGLGEPGTRQPADPCGKARDPPIPLPQAPARHGTAGKAARDASAHAPSCYVDRTHHCSYHTNTPPCTTSPSPTPTTRAPRTSTRRPASTCRPAPAGVAGPPLAARTARLTAPACSPPAEGTALRAWHGSPPAGGGGAGDQSGEWAAEGERGLNRMVGWHQGWEVGWEGRGRARDERRILLGARLIDSNLGPGAGRGGGGGGGHTCDAAVGLSASGQSTSWKLQGSRRAG
jgi:hypothetical protein